jgi:O-acetyl-ADP-ribose deacetylase (regulator of RNase III)/transcriptional regulator with XRE-family HTH domain
MPFQVIRNDITKVKADAIVNTANPEVIVGRGVETAIYNAAGRERLLAAREKIGPLEPGNVAITPAFDLDAKYIIHAVGSWWEGGAGGEINLLRKCYDSALELAARKRCKSIAFPLMATGFYGFPTEIGMQIAVDSFTGFLEKHDMEIYLVVYDSHAEEVFAEFGRKVRDYIDNDEKMAPPLPSIGAAPAEPLMDTVSAKPLMDSAPAMYSVGAAPAMMSASSEKKMKARKADSLEDVLKGIYTDSFAKHLKMLINRKGLKNSEVYAAANINKQYFSKLLKGQVNPSKEKVLALAVGLRLNLDEAVDFMRIAGYAMSPISQTDAVVRYFIEHEDYSVIKIDMVLFDYGLAPLSKEPK